MEPVDVKFRFNAEEAERDSRRIVNSILGISDPVDKLSPKIRNMFSGTDINAKNFEDMINRQRQVVKELAIDYQQASDKMRNSKLDPQTEGYKRIRQEVVSTNTEWQAEKRLLSELEAAYKKTFGDNAQHVTTLMTQQRQLRNEMAMIQVKMQDGTATNAEIARYRTLEQELQRVGTAMNVVTANRKALTTGGTQAAGLASGVQGVAGAFTAAQGAASLFADKNEDLAKIQTKLQAAMSITMGMQAASNMLHATSAFRITTVAKVTQLWNSAVKALTVSTHMSTAAARAFAATGIGLLVAGIAVAIAAYKNWSKSMKEAAAVKLEALKSTQDEIAKITALESVLKNSANSYDTRYAALMKIKEIMPGYNAELDKEGKLIEDNTGALEKYVEKLKAAAVAKIYADKLAEAQYKLNEYFERMSDYDRKIVERRLSNNDNSWAGNYSVMQNRAKELQAEVDRLKKSAVDAQKNAMETESPEQGTKAFWEQEQKNAKILIDSLTEAEMTTQKAIDAKNRYAEATKKLENWELKKETGGDKKGETEAEKAARRRLEAQQWLANREAELDANRERLRLESEQKQLDITEEGNAKKMAQIKLNYEQELLAAREYQQKKQKEAQEAAKKMHIAEKGSEKGFDYSKFDQSKLPADLQPDSIVSQVKQMEADAAAVRKKAEADLLKDLLQKYQDFNAERFELEKKYNADVAALEAQRTPENSAYVDRSIAVANKRFKDDSKAINDDELEVAKKDSELLVKIFANAATMSRQRLREVMSDTQKLINYLRGVTDVMPAGITKETAELMKDNADKIIELYDNLQEKQAEFEDRDGKSPFSSLEDGLKSLQKAREYADLAAKSTGKLSEKYRKLSEDAAQAGAKSLVASAGQAGDALGGLADTLNQLGEATIDADLQELARGLSAAANMIQSAAAGFATGGWIGAAIGGATSLISSFIDDYARAEQINREFHRQQLNFLREYQTMLLKLKEADYESIFGVDSIQKSIDATQKAIEAIKAYNEVMNSREWTDGIFKVKSELPASGPARELFNQHYSAIKKEQTDLQNLLIKTYDASWWEELWGGNDKYKTLFELAPQLWGGKVDGEFDIEAARLWLETNQNADKAIRDQVEHAIELKEAYNDAMTVVRDELQDTFGYLGDGLTDTIIEAIKTGGEEGMGNLKDVGVKAIETLGRKLIYELFMAKGLKQLQADMESLYETESDPEKLAKMQAELMDAYFNSIGGTVESTQRWAEEWQRRMQEQGYDAWASPEDAYAQQKEVGFTRSVSQDTFDQWLGQFAAIRIHTSDISGMIKEIEFQINVIISHLVEIERNTFDTVTQLKSIDARMKKIEVEGIKVK